MFGLFNRSGKTETRAAEIDVGALYSQFFAFGASAYNWQVSPAILAASLSVPDGAGALLTEARRLSRVSPILSAYQRCMVGGILTGEPERPVFAEGVPERVAGAAADLWERAHDVEVERDLLLRVIVDGELLILPEDQVVPPDGFEAIMTGPDWMREVRGYRIGKSASVRRDAFYLGDRRRGETRALPWIGPALPYAAALANIRISAGHGLGAIAKIAAVIANTSPDRITAGAGHRSGVIDASRSENAAGTEPITSVGVGSVPYLRPGEAIGRAMAGPDAVAQAYESLLERDAAGALNLPLSELRSDYSTGSFSNLRMAWQDSEREYKRRRVWWARHYRLPLWHALLSDAFADGRLPRMRTEDMDALKRPTWKGPHREPPQPEKEAQSLALLVDKGIIAPAAAAAQLET